MANSKSQISIQVTEHKSHGALCPTNPAVRVFVDGDFNYGYFVPERPLFDLLTAEQQPSYLEAKGSFQAKVPVATAQSIIDMGATPFRKPVLRKVA